MSDFVGLPSYIPTITSTLAIAISSLTLGWTIYRYSIRKPKFQVDIAVKKIVREVHPPDGPYVFVEALNMGPIPNRIGLTFLRKNWIKRDLLPCMPSFISRVCSGYAPGWGGLQTRSV